MGDIANKEQAEKCRDMAKEFMRAGDFEKATRFFGKSLKLFPLPGVAELMEKAHSLASGQVPGSSWPAPSSSGSRAPPARPAASSSPREGGGPGTPVSADGSQRSYIPAQEEGAARIVALSKKCYYQTLSISKTADEGEIKKAYKKLALKYHPDKNPAPSAEAAFKAINAAVETLSDPNKRQIYDEMGHDGASQHMSSGGGGGGFGGRNPNEMSPEDIMNMFFGQGMNGAFGGGGFRTYHFGGGGARRRGFHQQQARQREHDGEPQHGGGGLQQLFQLIPMLLLLLSMTGFFSSGGNSGSAWAKPFSLHQEHPYNIPKYTSASYGIAADIPYFVTESFRSVYGHSPRDVKRVEQQVQEEFKSLLRTQCDREKKYKARQINEAKRAKNQKAQEEALKAADAIETKSCDAFFNKYKFNEYR